MSFAENAISASMHFLFMNRWLLLFCLFIIILFSVIRSRYYEKHANCKDIKDAYDVYDADGKITITHLNDANAKIKGSNPTVKINDVKCLKDCRIMTAYNCCAVGDYSMDYVSTCAMDKPIADGIRCMDMEIYSINNIPVVATSSHSSHLYKESTNHIPFNDVVDYIQNKYTVENTDPMILHLRFRTNNAEAIEKIKTKLVDISGSLYKPSDISDNKLITGYIKTYTDLSGNTKNKPTQEILINGIKLSALTGKIIIIAENNYPFPDKMKECIALYSGTENTAENYVIIKRIDELSSLNTLTNKMGMILPSHGVSPVNININNPSYTGHFGNINFVGICFQKIDNNFKITMGSDFFTYYTDDTTKIRLAFTPKS